MKRYKVIRPDTHGYASFSFSIVDQDSVIAGGGDFCIYELIAMARNEKNAKLLRDSLNFCSENKQLFKEILVDLESGMFCNPDKETLNKIRELLNNAEI